MVIACSDGRLQEATDAFLHNQLNIGDYDRLYVPGGGGALSPSGSEFMRASRHQEECKFLVEAHGVEHLIVLFHGPAPGGPDQSMCADYTRKFKWASIPELRTQQERDAKDLIEARWQWAGSAKLAMYRCEVSADTSLSFVPLHLDP